MFACIAVEQARKNVYLVEVVVVVTGLVTSVMAWERYITHSSTDGRHVRCVMVEVDQNASIVTVKVGRDVPSVRVKVM